MFAADSCLVVTNVRRFSGVLGLPGPHRCALACVPSVELFECGLKFGGRMASLEPSLESGRLNIFAQPT